MPTYDYICDKCGYEFELFHSISDTSVKECPECGGHAHKLPSVCGFSIHNTIANSESSDRLRRDMEMETDLKQRLNIAKIDKLRGSTMKEVYEDARAQEGLIKEQMAAQQEQKAKQTAQKMREWKKQALKRSPQRAKEKKLAVAKENFKKRAIHL